MALPADGNESDESAVMVDNLLSATQIISPSNTATRAKTSQPSVSSFFKPINREEFQIQVRRDTEKEINLDGQVSIAFTKEERQERLRQRNRQEQQRSRENKKRKEIEYGERDAITGKKVKARTRIELGQLDLESS